MKIGINANVAILSTGEDRNFPTSMATPLRYEEVAPPGSFGMKSTGYIFPPAGIEFTPAERREIADFMINAWQTWAAYRKGDNG